MLIIKISLPFLYSIPVGNYSQFLEQRRARLLQWRERYEKQQRYIKEEEKYVISNTSLLFFILF